MHETSAINSTITSQPSSSPPPPPRSRLGHQCEPDDAEDEWEARAAPSSASQELLSPPPPDSLRRTAGSPPRGPLPPPPNPNEPPWPPPPPKLRLASWKPARLWTVTYQIHTRISKRKTDRKSVV